MAQAVRLALRALLALPVVLVALAAIRHSVLGLLLLVGAAVPVVPFPLRLQAVVVVGVLAARVALARLLAVRVVFRLPQRMALAGRV